MSFTKVKAEATTVTRDTRDLEKHTGNVYETLAIIGKRANQIQAALKTELQDKLDEFSTPSEGLEEVFENREQIEISRHYEKLPKPVAIAYQEWLGDDISFKKPEEENK